MKHLFLILFFFQVNLISAQFRIENRKSADINSFPIVSGSIQSSVFFDTCDFETVKIVANRLAKDIEMVTGVKPDVVSNLNSLPEYVIIIGTIEKCSILRQLSESKKIDFSEINGHWEQFVARTIIHPIPGIKQALIISGSDRRGTAYGVFELSKAIGVSPWYWWGDVVPEKKPNLFLEPLEYISKTPSVKYRGIFLNDEDWGLQPWAAKTYEPGTGDIGPKTYAKIFELLLRLKANLIWPAMHSCTKAFYHYPENKEVADAYGIIVGSSHAEPMLRNNVDEWDMQTMGDFNYVTNRNMVYQYWEQRARETKSDENIYTVGMRGIHDSGMEGVSSMDDRISILEKVINDQREIIQKEINMDVTKVPQAFIPYKEVLEIYDNGRDFKSRPAKNIPAKNIPAKNIPAKNIPAKSVFDLPEDITIVWPDDNYGYIRRLSDPEEQSRTGGGGVYYHLSYWGRPHDYLWLSSTHPMLMWEELRKAYENKCDRIWVFNVGDIKPMEYNMQLGLDMAFNMESFSAPQSIIKHLNDWFGDIFGISQDAGFGEIMLEYYNLAFERRPEFMGWSQTEPTRVTRFTELNHFFYKDEAQRRIDRYDEITQQVCLMQDAIPVNRKDAFYELVYYPVRCAQLINVKFLHYEKANYYALQKRSGSNDHAELAQQAYDSIKKLTARYNERLEGGKWKFMMSMNPRDLPVFDCPMIPRWRVPDTSDWGISIEGFKGERPKENMYGSRLPVFSPWGETKHFVDVFLTGLKDVSWQAVASRPWIVIDKSSGNLENKFLKKEDRIRISIDWRKVPAGERESGLITFTGEEREFVIPVIIFKPTVGDFSGFIETNRYLSVYAADYSRINNTNHLCWQIVDGLGYSGKVLMLSTSHEKSQNDLSPGGINATAEYDLFTFSSEKAQITVYCLPSHALNSQHQMRIAVAVDDSEPQTIDYRTFDRSETWKQNVLRNNAIIQTEYYFPSPGKHTLRITALDPGIMIDRITIDFGGLEPCYSAVPETKTGIRPNEAQLPFSADSSKNNR
jgi:hypothetical protein